MSRLHQSPNARSFAVPDHFYGAGQDESPPSCPEEWLKYIPVFCPTQEEFSDFETYIERVELWGRHTGIVKIIPPQEWSAALPPTNSMLPHVQLKHPIQQCMDGGSGLFRQKNIEKRKNLSVMEWALMCSKDEFKAPGPNQSARGGYSKSKPDKESMPAEGPATSVHESAVDSSQLSPEETEFYKMFDPHTSWLPPGTKPSDYTPEACRNLERTFWRGCGIGAPAWYGADMQGSLFTKATKTFNVAKLPSFLTRLTKGRILPGVNSPYLYFGMWRATFAWHVEDMDLYSINYIHWGAPKFWYAIPSERSKGFEGVMRGWFPSDTTRCPEFLRHKSYLASPTILSDASCRPNTLVQHQGEFVITFPRGYHAGFNLGLNCAESVNFALESWVDLGRRAGVCGCVSDSVTINVDALLAESGFQKQPITGTSMPAKRKLGDFSTEPRKRKLTIPFTPQQASIYRPIKPVQALSQRVVTERPFWPGCCLCSSTLLQHNLLRCIDSLSDSQTQWAHEVCARVIPECWVDSIGDELVVYGIDCIVKERWNLKCSVCSTSQQKAWGAKIQCTKGKCPKAFHVTCAIEHDEIGYRIIKEVQSDVIIIHAQGNGETSLAQPVKAVQKFLVDAPCPQHNPVVLELRRQRRQEKLKKEILALPLLSRIRVRVSNGVYEVTLLATDERLSTIHVMWGDGLQRELRWGSIVWSTPAPTTEAAAPHTPASAVATFSTRKPTSTVPLTAQYYYPNLQKLPYLSSNPVQQAISTPTILADDLRTPIKQVSDPTHYAPSNDTPSNENSALFGSDTSATPLPSTPPRKTAFDDIG